MDLSKLSKQEVQNLVTLSGNTLDEVKEELSLHLSRAMIRQRPDKTFVSYKIPQGFGGLIQAGANLETYIPFAISGAVTDFMTYVPIGSKDISLKVTISSDGVKQIVEKKLQDGFRSYSMELLVPKGSFVNLSLINQSKAAVEAIVGFTFKEVAANEIKTLGLIGSM